MMGGRVRWDGGWEGEGCRCTCLEAASLSIKEPACTK